MTAPIGAVVLYESREVLDRIAAATESIAIDRVISESSGVTGLVGLVLVEGRRPEPARIAELAASACVVVVVPEATPALEQALRDAGAVDVIAHGELARGLARAAHVARTIAGLREDRAELAARIVRAEHLTSIGLLASGVCHEVNNPNAAALANSEQLRLDLEQLLALPRHQQLDAFHKLTGEWLEMLGDCVGASRRIAQIVRALSAFARQGAEVEPAGRVQPNDEITTVLRLLGKEVRYRTRFDLELARDLPEVMAPPHALTQVITTLVMHALESLERLPSEERALGLRTRHEDGAVVLEVTDNAGGTTPASDPLGGRGLRVAEEHVRRLGGELVIDAQPGVGTTLRVSVPSVAKPAARPRPLSSAPPRLSRLRVLLVDDDDLLLRAVGRALREDFECTSVPTAQAALDRISEDERFDVLVTDVVMPEVDGLELWERVSKVDRELAERVIFLSGGVKSDVLESGIASTGRPFVCKPVSARELAKRIREVAA